MLEQFKILPNFFMSEDYLKIQECSERIRHDHCIVYDSDGQIMFPPIRLGGKINLSGKWESGFPYYTEGSFSDFQFIYAPLPNMNDSTLYGKNWKTTRKNIHKVKRELGEMCTNFLYDFTDSQLQDILLNWMPSEESALYNPESIIKHVYSSPHRIALIAKNELVGLLIYDMNWKYINFRYCFVKPSIDGLSDYARILFRVLCGKGDLNPAGLQINDGGSLGRDSLLLYKKRLNPVEIQTIRSNL